MIFVVNNAASLTLNNILTVAPSRTMTVNSGGTLNVGSYADSKYLSGPGTFTVSGTLGIGDPYGILTGTGTGATGGSIQVTGTRTYYTTANYTYNGGVGQVTGTGLTGANNLTVSGSGTYLTLAPTPGDSATTRALTVSADLTVDAGQFDQNGCAATHTLGVDRMLLTNGGSYINCNSASAGGTSASTLTFNTPTTRPQLNVGSASTFDYVGTGAITFSGGGATTNVSNAGVIRISGGGRTSGAATCGDTAVAITVSNTTNNTWATGSGNYYLSDVTLTRQVSSGGTPLLYGTVTKDAYSTGWGATTACGAAPNYAPTRCGSASSRRSRRTAAACC